MTSPAIPQDVRALLLQHIETYEQLEILVLLYEQREKSWTPAAIAGALNTTAESVEEVIGELSNKALVRTETGPGGPTIRITENPSLSRGIGRLAEAYRDYRLEIVRIVCTNAIDRIRNAALRTFADAFVLGRKK